MNDKDTEAFNKWFRSLENASQLLMFGLDVEYLKVWKAALVYCRAESSNRDSEIIARLNQENEKLKEALRHYADFNDEVSMYDSRGVSIARNTLREVAVDDICESKGW